MFNWNNEQALGRILRDIRKGVEEDALNNRPATRKGPENLVKTGTQILRESLIGSVYTMDEIDDLTREAK